MTWRMSIACWIPRPTNTHSQYGELIAFAPQQRLHEHTSLLLLWITENTRSDWLEGTHTEYNRSLRVHLINIDFFRLLSGDRGGTMAKVLCYKSEGRWLDSSWSQWIFHWHKILPWGRLSLYQKWVKGAFPGGKGGRCVRLTTLPLSCAVVM